MSDAFGFEQEAGSPKDLSITTSTSPELAPDDDNSSPGGGDSDNPFDPTMATPAKEVAAIAPVLAAAM